MQHPDCSRHPGVKIMAEITHSRKLSELLIELNVLTPDEISEAIVIARQINLPLGRALVLSNKISEQELRTIKQIQSLLKENAIDLTKAAQVHALVKKEGQSLAQALQKAGVSARKSDEPLTRSKFGNLLIDSGIVSAEQMDEALRIGYETGTPVGRMLVVSGVVNHSVIARALEIQVLLREGKMSYSQAVELLKSESLRVLPVEQSAEQRGFSKNGSNKRVRLGELLMLAGVLTEGDMLNVLEIGLTATKSLGDTLIERGLIAKPVLDLALKMQDMISDGSIEIRAAAAALQELASTGKAPDPAKLAAADEGEVRLGDLLQQTGLVDDEDIRDAIDLSSTFPAVIGKMLVVAGSIDEGTLLAALRCQFLIRNKAINEHEATQALVYAQRHRISLDDSLEELGIRIPAAFRRDSEL